MSDTQEPSMEEILASIRKIISEDAEEEPEKAVASEPKSESEAEEAPLELADQVEDEADEEPLELDDEVVEEEPELELVDAEDAPEPETGQDSEEPAQPSPSEPAAAAPEPAPADPKPAPADPFVPTVLPTVKDEERIISGNTEDYGVNQFASLERQIRMGQAGETLEDVVKGLLKPMLRGWLDENLPGLVERLIQEEIHKMSHRARRRWDDPEGR